MVAVTLLVGVLAYVFLLKPSASTSKPATTPPPVKEDKKGKKGAGAGANAGAGAGAGAGGSGAAAAGSSGPAGAGGGKGQSVAQLLKTAKKAGAALPKHALFLRSVKGGGADTTSFGELFIFFLNWFSATVAKVPRRQTLYAWPRTPEGRLPRWPKAHAFDG